ncbi:MAG TPA: tRNA (adenosine(37)-N6)-threonylcarbamoyltransferase complex dimerization subunit type 1 TsaB [Abditibacteriaceae bacterium]|jgi:tRNA threonylcarbamoyladenosine biosynthesis protein TsaB
MKILSLDTSATPVFAAVEVGKDNQIQNFHIRVLEQSRGLSRDIISAISGALEEAGWSLDDLDAIAVGLGPGSWTGLRVGLSTAKTLAQTRNLPLLGIPTFDAFASDVFLANHRLQYAVAPCRAGEIYAKSWQAGERILTLQNAADEIQSAAQTVYVMGLEGQNAARQITDLLPDDNKTQVIEITPQDIAKNLALLAVERLRNGERDDPLSLNPLYLAPSSAERVRAEKLARENQ